MYRVPEKSGTNGKNLRERITEACVAVDPDMLNIIQRNMVHRLRKCAKAGVDTWSAYCPSNKAYVMYLRLVPDFLDILYMHSQLGSLLSAQVTMLLELLATEENNVTIF
jgi:hypothetical protein